MNFRKVGLPLALALASAFHSAQGAVAYSNIPANAPFYSANTGSDIFGPLADPAQMFTSNSIAMSFVPTVTGTITGVTLGITVQPDFDGTVNVFLGQNPTLLPMSMTQYNIAQQPLGNAMTSAAVGTNNTLTSVNLTFPAQGVISGQTYYIVLVPANPNTSILWNENFFGNTFMSTYYHSSDDGASFELGGTFNSDALEVDVVEAIPEPSTWITGALMFGALALLGRRRFVMAKANAKIQS